MRRRLSRNRLIWAIGILAVLLLLLFVFLPVKQKREDKSHVESIYTCPMHPQIVRNAPGTCPICAMDLVRKGTGDEKVDTVKLGAVVKEPGRIVVTNIKAIRPKFFAPESKIEATGYITYDARRFNSIASRNAGRIEKLYVKYNFQPVSKGQKLFEIYSPELLTAQKDYIFLLEHDSKNSQLIEKSKNKLSLLGLTQSQINDLTQSRKPNYSVSVYSQYSGHVHDIEHLKPNVLPPQMGMDQKQTDKTSSSTDFAVREGMYIEKGEIIFNIINTEVVWGVIKVFPANAHGLQLNQKVLLTVGNDTNEVLEGKIDFIEPVFEKGSKAINARVYLKNSHHQLKIGDFINAKINLEKASSILIPEEAVLNLGKRKMVFLKTRANVFEAHEITTGAIANGWIEVLSGLADTDQIAANAQYLVDSESFVELK